MRTFSNRENLLAFLIRFYQGNWKQGKTSMSVTFLDETKPNVIFVITYVRYFSFTMLDCAAGCYRAICKAAQKVTLNLSSTSSSVLRNLLQLAKKAKKNLFTSVMLLVVRVDVVSIGRMKSNWMWHDVIITKLLMLWTTAWGVDGLTDGMKMVNDVNGAASMRVRMRWFSVFATAARHSCTFRTEHTPSHQQMHWIRFMNDSIINPDRHVH